MVDCRKTIHLATNQSCITLKVKRSAAFRSFSTWLCIFYVQTPRCLKISKKSLIQHCEWRMLRLYFERGQTVLPDRSILVGQKLAENAKILKFQMRHFEWFSNNVLVLVKNVLELDWVYELLYKRLSYLTITNTYWFFA